MRLAPSKLLVQLGSVLLVLPLMATAAERTYSGGTFLLELPEAGNVVLRSFVGGNAVQQPVTRGSRPDKYPDKSPGSVRYEDVNFELPIGAPSAIWGWVNGFSSPELAVKRNLSVSVLDFNFTETARRVFEGSVINFVELPACDGASKEPAYFKMGFAVATARDNAGTAGAKPTVSKWDKVWRPSNFRLTVDGLSANRVARIAPITIKRTPSGLPEYSNLVITVPTSDNGPWKQWAQQTIEGKPTEKNGKLEYLAANLQEVYLTVRLEGLGVVRVAPHKAEASGDQQARTDVELYVEKVTFAASP